MLEGKCSKQRRRFQRTQRFMPAGTDLVMICEKMQSKDSRLDMDMSEV